MSLRGKTIRAVIFDPDSTLVDHEKARKQLIEELASIGSISLRIVKKVDDSFTIYDRSKSSS